MNLKQHEGYVHRFRCCNACGRAYCHLGLDVWINAEISLDAKYCRSCDDEFMNNQLFLGCGKKRSELRFSRWPQYLIELKRLQITGKRITKGFSMDEFQLEILTLISKTKNHESHSTAQAIIANFTRATERYGRRTASKANFQRCG